MKGACVPECVWESKGAGSSLSTEISFRRCSPGLWIQDCGETSRADSVGAYLGRKNSLV